ncbi:LysM peptidoglycan-binding domain-containing protein [Kaistella antarctica]|uniref:LysM domain-containing protein n=1 Tax=Kaistella antarctica TaxID=266748 RepID=A0A3S4VEN9_9FLAO|nr:LysM domain-containing protein [Kaistella antarctica]KEY19000.1 hypothetical protein HY04_11155 [Kaistella antarctica]SEW12861.1 hypothetical protein SAMN05421765_2506 [Kaistella antarctica]VEH99103.1 Uncharacterised protein [Kaistella antarctica]
MENFNKHTIQENETLKSIALLYEIPVEELLVFHNNQSKENDELLINIRHFITDHWSRVAIHGEEFFDTI